MALTLLYNHVVQAIAAGNAVVTVPMPTAVELIGYVPEMSMVEQFVRVVKAKHRGWQVRHNLPSKHVIIDSRKEADWITEMLKQPSAGSWADGDDD